MRLLFSLPAASLAALAIVAWAALDFGYPGASPLRCFFFRGNAALRACEEVIASDQPADVRAEAYYNRGVTLDSLARHAEAARAYGEAVRLKPDYGAAYTNMGVALARLGRLDDAVDAYRAAIRETPRYAPAHYNLGLARAALRRWADALDAFREAVRLSPADAAAHYSARLRTVSSG